MTSEHDKIYTKIDEQRREITTRIDKVETETRTALNNISNSMNEGFGHVNETLAVVKATMITQPILNKQLDNCKALINEDTGIVSIQSSLEKIAKKVDKKSQLPWSTVIKAAVLLATGVAAIVGALSSF